MTFVLCVVLVALIFEYINGFHDTANAIATSIATKVMTPAQAILLSASMNLVGAMMGTAVAKTVGAGMVDIGFVNSMVILCALIGAITWNLITWWIGLPSSSSHALIGGLVGATFAAAHNQGKAIYWSEVPKKVHEFVPATQNVLDVVASQTLAAGTNLVHIGTNAVSVLIPAKAGGVVMMDTTRIIMEHGGVWHKVVKPMFLAPIMGIIGGFLIMGLLMLLFRKVNPGFVNRVFGKCQLLSAAWMSLEHGRNDAQKTMGIIALTLFAATQAGKLDNLPDWLGFLRLEKFDVTFWIKAVCALTIAAGTAAGGWKIIHTMGKNVVKMQPVHGFAAQTTAAAVIGVATHFGMPLSTTHVISGSIMGVGATKRFNAVKWSVVERMAWAWVFTIPVTAGIAYGLLRLAQLTNLAN
jgi:PiT family inorganic phosphate transporter